MNTTILLNNMYYGEITPKAFGLMGSPVYAGGCAVLENFIPLKTGGFRTRPGTRYVGSRSVANRLVTFYDNEGTPYILAIQNTSIQPYSTSTHEAHGSALTTAVTTALLWDMQHASVEGNMYMVSRSIDPEKITCASGTFGISTPTFTDDRTFGAADERPGVICFASGRLFLGSTNDEPNAIFASELPTATTGATKYLNFSFGDGTAADAIYLLENDMQAKRLAWLERHNLILSGTDKSVWQSDGSIPTPASFDMNAISEHGAAEIQPVKADGYIFYVSKNGKSIRAMQYSDSSGGYLDFEVSTFYDHLFLSGITELNISKTPQSMLIATCADGTIVMGTIIGSGSALVIGFAPQTIGGDGLVESCAVAEKSDGDEIWLLVNRGGTRTIEYMLMDDIADTALEESFYVDCGLYLEPASATVSGLSHLEGEEVTALGDGGVLPYKTVDSGEVTYDTVIYEIVIGYEYASIYRNLRPEFQINGTSQGKTKRVEQIGLRMFRSLGGEVGISLEDADLSSILYAKWGVSIYGQAEALFTGDIQVPTVGILDKNAQFYVYRYQPLPLNVLALFARIGIMEV